MRKFNSFIPLLPLLAIAAWVAWSFWQAYQPTPIYLQGQIEAQQYSVSSKVAGRLDQVLVTKGQQVEVGELIFSITSPELDAKLVQAQAGQAAASALSDEAENGARSQDIAAAKDQWQKAVAGANLARTTYRRVDNLYKDGVVSQQKRDEAYTQWQASKFTQNSALQMYELAQEGARDETKRAASQQAKAAAGAVAEVEAYAADTKVDARHRGEVSQILLQSGELAPQGFPVVTLTDMEDAWLTLNVREDRLSQFQVGQEFEATLPAFGEQSFRFKVSHVAVMGDFATWRATSSDTGFDLRTFEVEAKPMQEIENLRVGMSAYVLLDELKDQQ
ncbi:HlyD family efflux transporter periplasmic adaptor subunit [Alginatibacterium sediminis]|uniref:HlyD family efflux transporter periplasmic adaptor subunit n=1 Tax=Alginatibacterium sediminis TaxID=2164068 RepID=A0A420E6E3_9ALTE|nr:efflux RND transporter periplasmic adaptor subunit [Alginatibacterium sediminis]RKF12809.1 HlyD family efflux transporter periplasmic adaptor subunit [Alginatibacterium sediminis]